MTEAADQSFLNQAELLTDGVQIQVPTKEEVASGIAAEANTSGAPGESGKTSQGKVNLNTATKEELMTLPGIGEAKADSILTYRESAGGFQSIEQIKEIEGIKDGVFEKIKNADERLFMTWIVYVLEKGKSDFVKEKLSILGEKYDAASSIYI